MTSKELGEKVEVVGFWPFSDWMIGAVVVDPEGAVPEGELSVDCWNCKLSFKIQDALLAGRIRCYRCGQPILHVLGHFPSHMLGRLFLLELSALLSSAISGQAVKVHIAGFELLHQLCHKDSCTDVVEG